MRILLDTHVLLWAMAEPSKLSPKARRMIDRSETYVSAASIWEISIKVALRKLRVNPAELLAALEPAGFSLLPISGEARGRGRRTSAGIHPRPVRPCTRCASQARTDAAALER